MNQSQVYISLWITWYRFFSQKTHASKRGLRGLLSLLYSGSTVTHYHSYHNTHTTENVLVNKTAWLNTECMVWRNNCLVCRASVVIVIIKHPYSLLKLFSQFSLNILILKNPYTNKKMNFINIKIHRHHQTLLFLIEFDFFFNFL